MLQADEGRLTTEQSTIYVLPASMRYEVFMAMTGSGRYFEAKGTVAICGSGSLAPVETQKNKNGSGSGLIQLQSVGLAVTVTACLRGRY